jgi:hypothetical protein
MPLDIHWAIFSFQAKSENTSTQHTRMSSGIVHLALAASALAALALAFAALATLGLGLGALGLAGLLLEQILCDSRE